MSSNLHEIIIKLKDEATKGIQKIEGNFAGLKSSIERNREGLESLQVAEVIGRDFLQKYHNLKKT